MKTTTSEDACGGWEAQSVVIECYARLCVRASLSVLRCCAVMLRCWVEVLGVRRTSDVATGRVVQHYLCAVVLSL